MSEKKFTLDDFIGEEILSLPGKKINPKEKISRFSEIKISAIDPRIRKELEVRLKNIGQNINKLKHLKA
jgi:hypothetical protein